MKSVRLLPLLFWLVLLSACKPVQAPAAQPPFSFRVDVDPAKVGPPVNRLVLGNNVQWVDRGDELLTADGKNFDPQRLAQVQALGPTMLRYPGGSQADTYHWQSGMGEIASRGQSEHFFARKAQTVQMGTREFLELCESTGAQPLITVNVASGTPEEAADWVRQVNLTGMTSTRTGKRLPTVHYWEIGNEPYLKDDNQKALWMTPEIYAQRANAFVRAMRAVDAGIEVGIPLRSDTISGLPATPLPGFNRTVLSKITERFQFVSLHDAYLPLGIDKSYDDQTLLTAATGAAATVAADFEATRQLLRQIKPGENIRLAVTEYNALFSLGKGHSDEFIATQAGAVYVADLLRLFVTTPDLWAAHYWSLSGNWKFGAISNKGVLRPGYQVLKMYADALHGNLVELRSSAEAVSLPQVGYAARVERLELVAGLAMRDGDRLRVLLFNRDLRRSAQGSINVADQRLIQSANLKLYSVKDPADADDRADQFEITDRSLPAIATQTLSLPPAGMAVLTIEFAKGQK